MTQFDAAKAIREEIQGLNDVAATLRNRVRSCEMKLAEVEKDHNDSAKLLAFCNQTIEMKRKALRALEEQDGT
jgi:hypothetical protein